jgi:hypothetical protein
MSTFLEPTGDLLLTLETVNPHIPEYGNRRDADSPEVTCYWLGYLDETGHLVFDESIEPTVWDELPTYDEGVPPRLSPEVAKRMHCAVTLLLGRVTDALSFSEFFPSQNDENIESMLPPPYSEVDPIEDYASMGPIDPYMSSEEYLRQVSSLDVKSEKTSPLTSVLPTAIKPTSTGPPVQYSPELLPTKLSLGNESSEPIEYSIARSLELLQDLSSRSSICSPTNSTPPEGTSCFFAYISNIHL